MRYTGIGDDRYDTPRLSAALRASRYQLEKKGDVLMSSQDGSSDKTPSVAFNAIGVNKGEFGQAVMAPKSQGFFNGYAQRLQAFNALSQPPSPPNSAA